MMMQFSNKLAKRIESPQHSGVLVQPAASGMRLVIGQEGSLKEGSLVALYWLVDETDGIIADARFLAFGPPALIGAAESASELLIRKNHDVARRIGADLIDKQMRDKPAESAFPAEAAPFLNLVLLAIETAAEQCLDIPFALAVASPPLAESSVTYPGWHTLSTQDKISVIEEVIARDIRPYIELDAGGVEVLNLIEDREVIIAYQGSCTSCPSSMGSTLNAIQQILRTQVEASLTVTPDLSYLKI